MTFKHLYDAVSFHAEASPDQVALQWLDDGAVTREITYAQLRRRAEVLANGVRACTSHGDRVLLAVDMSLDFIAAFLACQYAGRIAVPIAVPSSRECEARTRATHVWQHCQPTLVVVSESARANAAGRPPLDGVPWTSDAYVTLPELESRAAGAGTREGRTPHDIAFLQYTSGSTSKPKGVIVGQSNLVNNLDHIRDRFAYHKDSVGLIWLPPHHDMGLVGGLLQPLYTGFLCLLMSPLEFAQRPRRWLEAVSRYRATTSGGPCFAYDLCLRRIRSEDVERLDLQSWSLAFVGAERIRADVMAAFAARFAPAGFRSSAITPCYGMAEATLMVSAQSAGDGAHVVALSRGALALGQAEPVTAPSSDAPAVESVSCGRIVVDHEAIVVDPETRRKLPDGRVGELWLRGPSVARGYFADSEATESSFGAQVADDDGGGRYLRTGDQAFLLDGELHICGRYKTIIIVRGKKYASEDIEQLLQREHAALASHGGVAFDAEVAGEESLVVVHELERACLRHDLDELRSAMQRTLGTRLGLRAAEIALVLPGSIPRTTSGKLQRVACRELYRGARLRRVEASLARSSSLAASSVSGVSGAGE
jgi:acyl-CoA synthetase (AMP-forming)/AMP-acid ligase II